MDTLGDYSALCRKLDGALIEIETGRVVNGQDEIFQLLMEDGMIKIVEPDKADIHEHVGFYITERGRRLLCSGGYSAFKTTPSFLPECGCYTLISYADGKFLIPTADDKTTFSDEFNYLGGEYRICDTGVLATGFYFSETARQSVINLFLSQDCPFVEATLRNEIRSSVK